MRIYVDFDDVLCETARGLVSLAQTLFGCRVPYEEISDFNLQKTFSLSDPEAEEFIRQAHKPELLHSLVPTCGGIATLRRLTAAGCEVVIVTGRPPASIRGSRQWLKVHDLLHLPLIHLNKYGRQMVLPDVCDTVPEVMEVDEFNHMHFDVIIDDAPAALDLVAPRQGALIIVFDRPWNRTYPLQDNMRRAASWTEVRQLLEQSPMGTTLNQLN